MLSTTICAAEDAFTTWVHSGKVYGNMKYYYIDTEKQKPTDYTTGHSNSIGGQLSYTTGSWHGIDAGITMMTTQPFGLPNATDTSIIGKDNGTHGLDANDGFSVLGQAYINYVSDDFLIWFGRQTGKTPLMDAKEVRMLPTTVQGLNARVLLDYGFSLTAGYYNGFKQRTSSHFENIVAHALGTDMKTITGELNGFVAPVSLTWENKNYLVRLYDYYAPNFMNSIYADARYKDALSPVLQYSVAAQLISQHSIGNADENLQKAGSITGGKRIDTSMFGAVANLAYERSKLSLAYTKVHENNEAHDSLVLPWDGTPLYTNMITSNNLFQSLYGNALNADTAYIGGTQGIKVAYSQNYDFTGIKGIGTALSTAWFDNSAFSENQRDYNAVLSYNTKVFSVAFKGIWVFNNSGSSKDGTISQTDILRQYRVIANYKF